MACAACIRAPGDGKVCRFCGSVSTSKLQASIDNLALELERIAVIGDLEVEIERLRRVMSSCENCMTWVEE